MYILQQAGGVVPERSGCFWPCMHVRYLYDVVLTGDLHSLLAVLQGHEDGVISPADRGSRSISGLAPATPRTTANVNAGL